MKRNSVITISALFLVLVITFVLSLITGEIEMTFMDAINGVFGKSSDYFNSVIREIRLPRTVIALFIGATLSISGYITSIALKNPLADSGILGIQSGATVGALVALILLPALIRFLPLFAFIGGVVAFVMLIAVSSTNGSFKPERIVLIGVAINSICTSLIGVITMTNAEKVKNALTWLNGSVANVTLEEMKIVALYSTIMLVVVIVFIPVLKVLLLDDSSIRNIGYNPYIIRIVMSMIAVILASISVAFVGIISFVGIIAPQIARKLIKNDIYGQVIGSIIIGAVLVALTDTIQRAIFSPTEIPVGILIGVIGAPVFLILASGGKTID